MEDISPKGKHKAIAAIPLNMRLFVSDDPEQKTQLKVLLFLVPYLFRVNFKREDFLAKTSPAQPESTAGVHCDIFAMRSSTGGSVRCI